MILTGNTIADAIEQNEALKTVAEAYTDIAGQRLLAIRGTIEMNRRFVTELASVFHVVSSAAEKAKVPIRVNRTGTLNLVVTSNHRFYGGLEKRLMDFYVAHTTITLGDLLVVGLTGKEYLRATSFDRDFKSVIFASDLPTDTELGTLLGDVWKYARVILYYPKMQSILMQRPVISEVGGIADIAAAPSVPVEFFIFEPELATMMDFFDRQITRVLIEQAFLEAELARTAARLVSMEEAKTRADAAGKENKRLLNIVKKRTMDIRVQEILLPVISEREREADFNGR